MAPDKRMLVVTFPQAGTEHAKPLSYVQRDSAGRPIADYVVITPRVERPDPCEALRKRFSAPKQ
jgi:hypothetical protein